ncbi:MAG: hypothetical protein COB37_02495 [Kordiimonadales bacterium]|nr:MAG: hypothetical protein COB37_02495 [Kordiimonadales bacterium]
MLRKRSLISTVFLCLVAFVASLVVQPLAGPAPAYAGEKVKKIKVPKKDKRPSLSYRPNANRGQPKYSGTVGILTLRDARVMKFFAGTDDFFAEQAPKALADILYFELKSSRLFRKVKRIEVTPSSDLSAEGLRKLAQQNNVDLVFLSDLQVFNMLREKMVMHKNGVDYKIMVRFGLFGQLIDPKNSRILWAEQVAREFSAVNTTGKIKSYDYSGNAIKAVRAGFDDLKKYIRATGLEMRS